MIIGINCGHTLNGQPGSGAVGYLNESDENRVVGKGVMAKLKQLGHTVIDCTVDKATSSNAYLNKAVSIANSQYLDLFVSIHFNAGGGKGTEVFTYDGAKHAEAVRICENMSKLGFVNRGVKNGSHLCVVRETKAKALLIETCFVDTKSDANLYLSNKEKVINAIVEGITGQTIVSNKPQSAFIDVPVTDSGHEHIKRLKDFAVITGYPDGTFRPDEPITRRQAAIMISKALKYIGQ